MFYRGKLYTRLKLSEWEGNRRKSYYSRGNSETWRLGLILGGIYSYTRRYIAPEAVEYIMQCLTRSQLTRHVTSRVYTCTYTQSGKVL